MKTVEVLQVLGALIGALASTAMAFEKKLVGTLRKQGATSSAHATALSHPNRISRWRLSRLLQQGAIRVVRDTLYFLDEGAYRALQKRRAWIVIPAVLAAVMLVLVLHWAVPQPHR